MVRKAEAERPAPGAPLIVIVITTVIMICVSISMTHSTVIQLSSIHTIIFVTLNIVLLLMIIIIQCARRPPGPALERPVRQRLGPRCLAIRQHY